MSSLKKTIDNINQQFGTNFNNNFANRLTNAFYNPRDWWHVSPHPLLGRFADQRAATSMAGTLPIPLSTSALLSTVPALLMPETSARRKLGFLQGEIDNINEYEIPLARKKGDNSRIEVLKNRLKKVQLKRYEIQKYLNEKMKKRGLKIVNPAKKNFAANRFNLLYEHPQDYYHSSPHSMGLPVARQGIVTAFEPRISKEVASNAAWLINNYPGPTLVAASAGALGAGIASLGVGLKMLTPMTLARSKITALKQTRANVLEAEIPLAQKNKDEAKVKNLKAYLKTVDRKIAEAQAYYDNLARKHGLKK